MGVILRSIRRVVFHASREGRASEIAAWSNGLAALAAAGGCFVATRSWWLSAGAFVLLFALLRVALTNRVTLWIAAALGTLTVATAAGALGWLFAHVVAIPSVPVVAGILVAAGSATVPAWAYRRLAQLRADQVPDSLVDPVHSRPSR